MDCLLCATSGAQAIWRISGRELRLLFEAGGRTLSEEAYGPLTPEVPIDLFECRACGFQFFDPALAGTGRFYEELEKNSYYPDTRPEFDFALDLARKHGISRVLDIGGGTGAFLDLARAQGLATSGIELNEQAAQQAAAKGHTMLQERLEEIDATKLGGPVELITLFQVVEHVPDPCGFLRSARRLVKPGGFLIVAVPGRDGVFRLLPLDPANLPPHHISRWRVKDLRRLGDACGLRTVETGAEILYGRGLTEFWQLNNRLAKALGRAPRPGGDWLPSLIGFLYRKLGCRHYLPRRGRSIHAVFQADE